MVVRSQMLTERLGRGQPWGADRVTRWVGQIACISSLASLLLLLLPLQGFAAAEPATACCSDLEQRIAELEQLSARKRGGGLDLKVSGSINRAVMFWDDGATRNAAVVTNDNDNSTATLEGEYENLEGGWSVGFVIDFDSLSAGSSDINQRATGVAAAIEPGEISLWIGNQKFGHLSMGQTSTKGSSGGANEADLSGTEAAGYSGVSDIGGGFFVRRQGSRDGSGLLRVNWNDLIDSLDEPDGRVISYNTPEFAGFAFSALWGEDDVWNIGAAYTNATAKPFSIVARLAYNGDLQGALDKRPNDRTLSGSVSLIHIPTGLNISLAGGERRYTESVLLTNGASGVPSSPYFGYLKLGWRAQLLPWGDTAVFAEYGRFLDYLGGNANAATVAGLAGGAGVGPGAICATPSAACTVASSDALIAGAGAVQRIDAAHAQIYLGARHYEAETGLISASGAKVHSAPLSGFNTVIGGLLIEF